MQLNLGLPDQLKWVKYNSDINCTKSPNIKINFVLLTVHLDIILVDN